MEKIAYLPCPIVSQELKQQVIDLGYTIIDDDFAPADYVLPAELLAIKSQIDADNAEILAKAKQYNDAMQQLIDEKRPASRQWVRDYVAENGGAGGGGGTPSDYNKVKQQVQDNSNNITALQNSQKMQDNIIADIGLDTNLHLKQLDDKTTDLENNLKNGFVAVSKDIDALKKRIDELPSGSTAEIEQQIDGVCLTEKSAIDTGLTMNGLYTFQACGYVVNKNMGVIVGAYKSNTERTTLRLLGSSNKIQAMWANTNERNVTPHIPYTYELTSVAGGYTDADPDTPIYLLNETANGDYWNATLCWVKLFDENYNLIRNFKPYKKGTDIYIKDLVENKIYRPLSGSLKEM